MQSLESENLAPNSKVATVPMLVGPLEQTLQITTKLPVKADETLAWSSQKIRPAVLLPPNYLKAEAEDLRRRVRELEDALIMDASFQVEDDNSETFAESACADPIQSPLQAQLPPRCSTLNKQILDQDPDSLARCVRLLNLEIYNLSVSLARSLPLPEQTSQLCDNIFRVLDNILSLDDLEAYVAPRILQACLASWCTKTIQVRSSNSDDTPHVDRSLGTRNSLGELCYFRYWTSRSHGLLQKTYLIRKNPSFPVSYK